MSDAERKFELLTDIEEHVGRPMPSIVRAALRAYLPVEAIRMVHDWILNVSDTCYPVPVCVRSHKSGEMCVHCGETP